MNKRLIKDTAIVFFFSLFAKFLGFLKSMIQASFFGASIEMDAYNLSSGFVSNILYMLTTSIAVAFVPMYIKKSTKNNHRLVFASRTITALALASLLLSVVFYTIAPFISRILAPSFDIASLKLTEIYLKVLLTGIVFSFAANMYTSILNAEKKYMYSALSSFVNSTILILFILLFYKSLHVWALVISIPCSFFIQWVVLFSIGKKYARISLRYGIRDESIKILLVQATPILISQATVEINQVVDRALLSGIEVGALTAVAYSAVLYQFVTTLISAPLSTVLFTELSEAGAVDDKERIGIVLQKAWKLLIIICLPICFVISTCSKDIVSIVFGHGNFTSNAINQCSDGLIMYGMCLLPVSIKTIISRAYYSLNDTRRPMILGMLEVALNICLSLVFVKPFGIIGVVGATAISSYVSLFLTIVVFCRRYVCFFNKDTRVFNFKVLFAAIVSVVSLILIPKTHSSHFVFLFVITTICFFCFYFVLYIIGEKTIIELVSYVFNLIKIKLKKRN